jgi:hypothetical protein
MRRTLLLCAAIAASLSATACGGTPPPDPTGSGTGTVSAPATPAAPATAPPTTPPTTSPGGGDDEDCVTYDAQVLLRNYAAGVHVIRPDHGSELIRVYGAPDALVSDQAFGVARRFETICYIGRGNNPEFVFEYWQDPSGFTTPDIPGFGDDCLNYNPPDLVVDPVGGAWRVRAGSTDLQHFASAADANRGRAVLAQQDLLCYVHTRTPLPDDDPADITYSFWGTD